MTPCTRRQSGGPVCALCPSVGSSTQPNGTAASEIRWLLAGSLRWLSALEFTSLWLGFLGRPHLSSALLEVPPGAISLPPPISTRRALFRRTHLGQIAAIAPPSWVKF